MSAETKQKRIFTLKKVKYIFSDPGVKQPTQTSKETRPVGSQISEIKIYR